MRVILGRAVRAPPRLRRVAPGRARPAVAVFPQSGDAAIDVVVDAAVDQVLLRVVLHLVEVEVLTELLEDVDVDPLNQDGSVILKGVDGGVVVVLEAQGLEEHRKGDRVLRVLLLLVDRQWRVARQPAVRVVARALDDDAVRLALVQQRHLLHLRPLPVGRARSGK